MRYMSAEDVQGVSRTEIQRGGPPQNFNYLNRCNSATDCSITVTYGTDFHHITIAVLQTFKVTCSRSRLQRDHQIIVYVQEI